MRVLGIDSSTKYAGVAVVEDGNVLVQSSLQFMAGHSEKLLPEIVHILEIMKINLESIDYYAVTVGPGSFTGLRVAVSTVKGLAFVTRKNVVPLSTLEIMANNFPYSRFLICPILDARKKEVYGALFRWQKEALVRLQDDSVMPIERLKEWVNENTLFIGDGSRLYRDRLREIFGEKAFFAEPNFNIPSPALVGLLGEKKAMEGFFVSAKELEPYYFRKSEAEIKFG